MTKHSSHTIIWDDTWDMIQVRQHYNSKIWVFFIMVNKQWYYGEGETIPAAQQNCETKIFLGVKAGKANIKEKLEELF